MRRRESCLHINRFSARKYKTCSFILCFHLRLERRYFVFPHDASQPKVLEQRRRKILCESISDPNIEKGQNMSPPKKGGYREPKNIKEKSEWVFDCLEKNAVTNIMGDPAMAIDFLEKYEANNVDQKIKDAMMKANVPLDFTKEDWIMDAARICSESMSDKSFVILCKIGNKEINCETALRMWREANPWDESSDESFKHFYNLITNQPGCLLASVKYTAQKK